MLLNLYSSASFRLLMVASLSLASSSPSPRTGPTAWIMRLALRLPPPVIATSPVGTSPRFEVISSHSSWILGPPFRLIAPATPPPSFRWLFAALTIQSTERSVISFLKSSKIVFPTVIFKPNTSLNDSRKDYSYQKIRRRNKYL